MYSKVWHIITDPWPKCNFGTCVWDLLCLAEDYVWNYFSGRNRGSTFSQFHFYFKLKTFNSHACSSWMVIIKVAEAFNDDCIRGWFLTSLTRNKHSGQITRFIWKSYRYHFADTEPVNVPLKHYDTLNTLLRNAIQDHASSSHASQKTPVGYSHRQLISSKKPPKRPRVQFQLQCQQQ